MRRVIPDALHDSQPFGLALPEKNPITRCEEFGPLNEAESNESPISGPDEWPINVDNRAGLANRSNMQHGLILALNGGGMRKDQD